MSCENEPRLLDFDAMLYYGDTDCRFTFTTKLT